MDNVLTIAEERLNLFAHMANSACGTELMVLWDEKTAVHLHLPG